MNPISQPYRFPNQGRLGLWAGLALACSSLAQRVRRAFPLQERKGLHGERDPRILIVKLDHLGDFMLALPALESLRRHYGSGRFTLLAGYHAKPWVWRLFHFDEIIYWKDPFFDRDSEAVLRRPGRQIFELLRLACRLSWHSFDLAVDLSSGSHWITLLLTSLSRAPHRVGDARWGRGIFLTRAVDIADDTPIPERHRRKLAALGIGTDGITPSPLRLPEAERVAARERLQRLGWNGRRPLIGLHARAGCRSKDWDPYQAGRLSDILARKHGAQVLWTGVHGDTPFYEEAKRSMTTQPIDLVGKTDLAGLAGALAHCALYISVDSGPLHLAAALGVPVVGLFSGTNRLDVWKPLGERQVLLQKKAPCAPCGLSECRQARHACMEEISVEDVLEAGECLLKDLEEPYVIGAN